MSDIENDSVKEALGPKVVGGILIDGDYFFMALYNNLEGKWKNKSTLEKHKNQYYDGYEFIKFYFENISIFMRDLITSMKIQANIDDKHRRCVVYMTKGSRTSWRNNVLGDYQHGANPKISPLLDIIYRENKGLEGVEIFQNFNLESDDCISIVASKLVEKHPDIFIQVISKNKRLIQLECDNVTVLDINRKPLRETSNILSSSVVFSTNKFLFFLILKGDEDHDVPKVFYEEKTDMDYDNYYENNELIAEECQDIILAERLRTNYLIFDYNSIPKKLIKNFIKNNTTI